MVEVIVSHTCDVWIILVKMSIGQSVLSLGAISENGFIRKFSRCFKRDLWIDQS